MQAVKNILGSFYAAILLIVFKSKTIKKITDKNILSIYFHNPTIDVFEKSVRWLKENGFKFIDVNHLLKILNGELNIAGKLVIISFDDGWQGNISLVPILETLKIPILLFVSVEPILSGNFWWEYINKTNTNSRENRDELRKFKFMNNHDRLNYIDTIKKRLSLKRSAIEKNELVGLSKNKYITIGSHTVNHPITLNCSDEELEMEYEKSKELISSWIEKDIEFFSYPNGKYDERDFFYLKKSGYKLSFTTKPNTIAKDSNKFELPRYNVNDSGSMIINKAKMLGLWQNKIPKYFLRST